MEGSRATVQAPDGLRLAVEDHLVAGARAHVLIVHGFGEHKGRYGHVTAALAGWGYACHLFDLRGHGASEGPRGDVATIGDFQDDLECVVRHVRSLAAPGGAPLVILGHSLGGLIALDGLLRHPGTFAAAVVTSPFMARAYAMSWLEQAVAWVLGLVAPALPLRAEVDPRSLSHDPSVVDAYTRDGLVLHRITPRLWQEIELAQRRVLDRAGEISLPALFLVAGDDRVVDAAATREVFRRLGSEDKRLLTYDGYFHEVLNEVGRDRVLDDLRGWLDARLPS